MGQQADDAIKLAAEIRAKMRVKMGDVGFSKDEAEAVYFLSQALVNVLETAHKSDGIPELDAG